VPIFTFKLKGNLAFTDAINTVYLRNTLSFMGASVILGSFQNFIGISCSLGGIILLIMRHLLRYSRHRRIRQLSDRWRSKNGILCCTREQDGIHQIRSPSGFSQSFCLSFILRGAILMDLKGLFKLREKHLFLRFLTLSSLGSSLL
jgi:hypothetical protein